MPGSDPNEEGLRALGRAVDDAAVRREAPGPDAGGGRPRPDSPAGSAGTGGGDGHGRHRRGGKRHKRRWVKRTLLISLAVILLAAGSAVGYAWYLNHKIHRVSVSGLDPGESTGSDAGTENILLVGSTTRCGLAHQTAAYGLCTEGVTGVNSDVIMILHLNPATKTVSVLSIPRDLFIPNARRDTGAYKIDAALAQGPSQLVAAIEEDLAIPIDRYVELTFDSFAAVVTALGGITIDFPDEVFDHYSGLKVLSTGCKHLDGVQALQLVRARHLQYWVQGQPKTYPYTWPQESESDLARILRDHEFLRILATEVAKRGLGNPSTDLSMIQAVAPHLTVDNGFSASDMVHLVLTYHSVNVNEAPQLTLPVEVGATTLTYEGEDFGDVEFPARPVDESVIDSFLGLEPDTNTMTGEPLPSPSAVTVSVLNGTAVTGQATSTAAALSKLGFHTVGTGTTTPTGQYAETTVSYSSRTPADEAAAQLVADSLSGQVILKYGPTTDGAQVTVTTGTNFTVDSVPPHEGRSPSTTTSTTSTTGTTGTTTTTTRTSSSSTTTTVFQSPSSSNPPLEPWDPRACPAGVKGAAGTY